MKDDYKITVLNKLIKTKDFKIPKHLPNIPFRLLIFAPSYSGKTNMITNMLYKPKFRYKHIFNDNIFLFSKTALLDDTYDILNIPPSNIKTELDRDFIEEILKEQEMNIKRLTKHKTPQILFIFEDIITEFTNNDELLKRILFMGRHYNLSVILTSQTYHACPKNMRLNASHIILFNLPDKDVTSIIQELPLQKEIFQKIYHDATKDKYNFLYMDLKNKKYYHNFTEQYIIRDNEENAEFVIKKI